LIAWLLLFAAASTGASAQETAPVHGLWVWRGRSVLNDEQRIDSLAAFCQRQGINEVYVSVSERGEIMSDGSMARMIDVLHGGHVRVEALFSSENADEGGKHLQKLLDRVDTILEFNEKHPRKRFDGIHLDVEPQKRPENKGKGNLRFLPGLVEVYRAVCQRAKPAGLTVNADIESKLLKGSPQERGMLLSSLPRFTLMMYEVTAPDDTAEKKTRRAKTTSEKFLEMAYDGVSGDSGLAKMLIGLRTKDYGELLPQMLAALDEANASNSHYLGWARLSYNDTFEGQR
jgi:hypothetical protein